MLHQNIFDSSVRFLFPEEDVKISEKLIPKAEKRSVIFRFFQFFHLWAKSFWLGRQNCILPVRRNFLSELANYRRKERHKMRELFSYNLRRKIRFQFDDWAKRSALSVCRCRSPRLLSTWSFFADFVTPSSRFSDECQIFRANGSSEWSNFFWLDSKKLTIAKKFSNVFLPSWLLWEKKQQRPNLSATKLSFNSTPLDQFIIMYVPYLVNEVWWFHYFFLFLWTVGSFWQMFVAPFFLGRREKQEGANPSLLVSVKFSFIFAR